MADHSPLGKSPDFGYAESFKDLKREGYVPLALGPIYAYAGVQANLLDCFASDPDATKESEPVRGMELQLDRPVLARCEDWNCRLSIIDQDNMTHFERWLMSQHFVDRVKRKVFVVRRYIVPVMDPIAFALGKEEPTTLNVYTLSGRRGLLKPLMTYGGVRADYLGVGGQFKDPKDITPDDEVQKAVERSVPRVVDFMVAPPEEAVLVLARSLLDIVDNA